MKKSEKQIKLLSDRLARVERISISDAVEMLNITESSVRRIFSKMESAGLAIRVHGGLAKINGESNSYNYSLVESVNLEQKRKIASAVASMVTDSNSVYLDSGSTLYRISLAVANSINAAAKPNLKIFTNSLKNLEVLQGHPSIVLIGGSYRKSRHDFCGFIAEKSVSNLNFDMCVLGADGVDASGTITTTDFDTAKLCMSAIRHSKKRILAVDSSKFGKTALITYANLNDITTVVTDKGIPQEYIELLGRLNIETITV